MKFRLSVAIVIAVLNAKLLADFFSAQRLDGRDNRHGHCHVFI